MAVREVRFRQAFRPLGANSRHMSQMDASRVTYWSNRELRLRYAVPGVSAYHVVVEPRNHILREPSQLVSSDLPVLRRMKDVACEAVSAFAASEPFATDFRVGFPRIQVHEGGLQVNILSMDFCRAYDFKSWNHFGSRFFLDLDEAISGIERDGRLRLDLLESMNYMAQVPRCPRCGFPSLHMAILRRHMLFCSTNCRPGEIFRMADLQQRARLESTNPQSVESATVS